MAIDFRLTARQRELQLQSRKFAREVLSACDRGRDPAHSGGAVCRNQARLRGNDCSRISAEVHSGFRRRRERRPDRYRDHGRGTLRGERQRYIDVDRHRAWSVAALDRRHERAAEPAAATIPKQAGAPLAGFCATEPGGSANAASPPPGEGVRTTADAWAIDGSLRVEKAGFRRPLVGIARAQTFSRYSAAPIQRLLPNVGFR